MRLSRHNGSPARLGITILGVGALLVAGTRLGWEHYQRSRAAPLGARDYGLGGALYVQRYVAPSLDFGAAFSRNSHGFMRVYRVDGKLLHEFETDGLEVIEVIWDRDRIVFLGADDRNLEFLYPPVDKLVAVPATVGSASGKQDGYEFTLEAATPTLR